MDREDHGNDAEEEEDADEGRDGRGAVPQKEWPEQHRADARDENEDAGVVDAFAPRLSPERDPLHEDLPRDHPQLESKVVVDSEIGSKNGRDARERPRGREQRDQHDRQMAPRQLQFA